MKLNQLYKNIISRLRFSWGMILLGLGIFFTKLAGVKGSPSESKRIKGKYVSVFIFDFNFEEGKRDCLEIARGRIGAQGDIYIFPAPQSWKKDPIHESFHSPKDGKPAEYHIIDRGIKTREEDLMYGDKDFTSAFRFAKFARIPSCFCFRCGEGLKKEDIERIVEKLIRYVYLDPFSKQQIVSSLITEGKCQFRLPPEVHKDLLRRLRRGSK